MLIEYLEYFPAVSRWPLREQILLIVCVNSEKLQLQDKNWSLPPNSPISVLFRKKGKKAKAVIRAVVLGNVCFFEWNSPSIFPPEVRMRRGREEIGQKGSPRRR
ncbi:hypothetical protein CDAR_243171 [Caerostris darwini]|uniref:Uncharacterized protein n=1 Tax=Caerostris darwini TaxID=1538125 RepID=A0AAV4MLS5_9ARAC|nr:hypothetical protein CDAR_243171 [Caerostris darwini]